MSDASLAGVRSSDGPDVTVIDADLPPEVLATVVTCDSGEGPDTVLEGFTITGGNSLCGGGMANSGTSPTVTNCTFSGNEAGVEGGGMYNDENIPTVTSTGFCDNTPDSISGSYTDGGGITFMCPCPDLDGDGTVGITDLLDLLANWGNPYGINDLLALLSAWGPCP